MKTNKFILILVFVFLPTLIKAQDTVELNLSLKEKKLPFGLVKLVPEQKPKISLVLSGGGSRAISHIGVLQAIEEFNIPIDYIVGTSMGSVVGGLYSVGYSLSELDVMFKSLNWEELFFLTGADRANLFVDQKITEDKSLFTIRLNGFEPVIPQSINTGNKISNFLTSITLSAPINKFDSFENLLYNFKAVATELVTGDRIVLSKGSLSETMRASSSVSFLLPPIKMDSLILVDGGLVDNLPIKSAEELNPDFIIASDASSKLKSKEELIYPWDIADQIVSIPSRKVWEENKTKADVLITQDLYQRKNNNFNNLEEVVKSGYRNSKPLLIDVNEKIKNKFIKKLQKEGDKFLKIGFNKKIISEVGLPKYLFTQDSILKSEFMYLLYSLYEKGDFEKINASVDEKSNIIYSLKYAFNPQIKYVSLNGVSLIPLDSAYTHFTQLLEKPYNVDRVLNSLLSLVKYYRSKNYILATIENVKFKNKEGELYINVNEGKVSDILVEGNDNTITPIITREFSSIEDEYLLKDNFDESLENLAATDLFDNIVVQIEDSSRNENYLKLSLDEKIPNVLRFGLRIDNENFTQFAIDLRNENLFGSGSELGVSIAGGSRNMSYILEHKTNRIFDTYLTYKAQAFYKFNDVNIYADDNSENEKRFSRSRISEYRQRFYGGFIGLGAHLKKLGTLTAEAKYEVNEVGNLYSFPKSSEYKVDISSLKFRLQIDSQNKYPYPTKGIYVNTFYETAQKILGGDISFAKFSFDYSGYFTFAKKHTLKPRFIFGFADETLPLSQQFNFGGQSTFLGYRDFEYRGRQILVGSLEYRYLLPINFYFDTYIKFRYDLGSSWINQEQIHFDDLKHGLGLTVSFDTPIGPADFSVGRSLYLKDTSPERILSRGPLMFYFTIGYYY
ncbi:MAG: BamA/TamA family outer membrane protein [Ignavibacteriales bacterium]|nr:BamA/TamA family outer membrane protein [Ignavibacteriales bacterium]